jgi:lipoyl(octanoyl) transferase
LGLRDYREVWDLQQATVTERQRDAVADTLILVEHPDVITLGRGANSANVLAPGDTPVIAVERGGDVTYHGPGQLVAYPILLLREDERDLHRFLRTLEEAVIRTVADFGLAATRRPGKTGVWTTDQCRKLASIGVAVRKWVTLHGLALNITTDLSRFAAINPCGFDASVMTSMARELGQSPELSAVKAALGGHLGALLDREWRQLGS